MLNMRDFADAIVGVPGKGLNPEQRKLLTVGVELAAKPKLLLFLDEPTSGLDSQASWAICTFLRKLADSGQAVLCTIHQPSAAIFQQFDRLLLLAGGGRTVYFGDIGPDSRILIGYFESHGARGCGDNENPAEYMLEVVSQGTNLEGEKWHSVWKASSERHGVDAEVAHVLREGACEGPTGTDDMSGGSEFAMPFTTQLREVASRAFRQYWRMPTYVFSKFFLGMAAGLFIGVSLYNAGDGTITGTQIIATGIFIVVTVITPIMQQIQHHFIVQRTLYEVRERPSRAYSWVVFLSVAIVVEIAYLVVVAIVMFACFYYPMVGVQSSAKQGLALLFCIQLLVYASSLAHMTAVALPDATTASAVSNFLIIMALVFCGVVQPPAALPGFWFFMYRVSPFTYWISGIVSTQLHGRPVTCSVDEISILDPPPGQTCGEYFADYAKTAPGQLKNPDATTSCAYCSLRVADQYLAGSDIFYADRWRNLGIVCAFIVFNMAVTVLAYRCVWGPRRRRGG